MGVRTKLIYPVLLGLAAGSVGLPAEAQNNIVTFYSTHTWAQKAGCPGIVWAVKRSGAQLSGYALYDNASGISLIKGQRDPNGQFSFTLTKLDGNGPVGTATGQVQTWDAGVTADVKGEGCANLKVSIVRSPAYTGPNG